jgi:hypothetical protein
MMPAMQLTAERMKALGLNPGALVSAGGAMRYTVAVVQRERERLAKIFRDNQMADIAAAILDTSQDDLVFKWMGPEKALDAPPKPFVSEAETKV